MQKLWFGLWAMVLGLVTPSLLAADVTTNDILAVADLGNAGFQKGFGIGLPILIVMVVLGWVLFGLRKGTSGRRG